MNVIECIHCKTKYAIKLHKIPKHQKFLKCSQCQENTPFPFYSQKEQEFVIMLDTDCNNCKKNYSIPSSKFIAPYRKAVCSSCQNQFEIYFSNYENLLKLNQKTASYLHSETVDKKETFNEQEKKEFHKLVGDVLDTSKNTEKKDSLENLSEWKEKVMSKEGVVPANLREQIFLSNRKIEELDKADIPSLVPKEEQTPNVEKKKKEKSNFFVGVIILTLFILVFVAYIYIINQ